MSRARFVPVLLAALLVLPGVASGAEEGVTADPAEVTVGLFFHGATVRVAAPRREGETAVFRLLGPGADVRLKVKDRVGGVLWTSVAEVRLADVPSVLLVQGGSDLPPAEALDRAGLTPSSLRESVLGDDPSPRETLAFDEMLKLYGKRGLYAVRSVPGREDATTAGVEFELPPDMPTGDFDLSVTYFEGGRAVGESHTTLTVRQTGFVRGITRLAEHHGIWYGVIAVVVAVLAGIATGWLFGRKGKHKG